MEERRLDWLLGNLLAASLFENGAIKPPTGSVDLTDIVMAVLLDLRPNRSDGRVNIG